MQLSIITPEKTLFSAAIKMVTVPGTEGDFGVLPNHAPFISTIRPGVISIEGEDGMARKIAILGGIAEVVPERCTVLAETAEDWTSLSIVEIQVKRDTALKALENAGSDMAKKDAEKIIALTEAVITMGDFTK